MPGIPVSRYPSWSRKMRRGIEDILADRPDLYNSPALFNRVLDAVSKCGLSNEDWHAVYVEARRQTIAPHGVAGDDIANV